MPAVIQDRTNYLLRRPPRAHPYERVRHDSHGQYYDFKVRPDLIDEVLEDFKPHESFVGVQEFYALLRYINRSGGPLESTDCGLRQSLYVSRNSAFPEKLGWVGGRLMVMHRRLEVNYRLSAVRQSIKRMQTQIKKSGRHHSFVGFVIGPFPTIFRVTNRRGYQIDIEFAMWGDTFEEAMQRFSDVVRVLEGAVRTCEGRAP